MKSSQPDPNLVVIELIPRPAEGQLMLVHVETGDVPNHVGMARLQAVQKAFRLEERGDGDRYVFAPMVNGVKKIGVSPIDIEEWTLYQLSRKDIENE